MNWNYIAGFFDGEGSIGHNGKGYRVTISQTNKEVLDQIKKFTKYGYVIEVTKRKKHWKDSWVYYVARQDQVYDFLINIKNFSIVKKDLIKIVIPKVKIVVGRQIWIKIKQSKIEKDAKVLRKQGLTYREIGKKLKIDFGHARRKVLK